MIFGDKPVLSEHRAKSRCGVEGGGEVVAEGTPEQVAEEPRSYTGHYLKPLLEAQRVETVAAKPKRKRKSAVQEREAAE